MKGNFHARFLGEGKTVTSFPYPIKNPFNYSENLRMNELQKDILTATMFITGLVGFISGLVQKRLILGNKDNRRPALIFMRVLTI